MICPLNHSNWPFLATTCLAHWSYQECFKRLLHAMLASVPRASLHPKWKYGACYIYCLRFLALGNQRWDEVGKANRFYTSIWYLLENKITKKISPTCLLALASEGAGKESRWAGNTCRADQQDDRRVLEMTPTWRSVPMIARLLKVLGVKCQNVVLRILIIYVPFDSI